MANGRGYSESYAKASRIIYKFMAFVGILFALSLLIFVVLKQVFIKIISFLFDGDYEYKVVKAILDVIRSIVAMFTGGDAFSTDWLPHTNKWSTSFEHATTHSGAKLMMFLLICLVVLVIAYIFTIVMRHHNGEMAPLLNDREARKVRRKIIRKIDAGHIDRSENKSKEKKKKPSKFEIKVKRHIRRELKVRIHTYIPESTPVPIKHYHISLLIGETDPIDEKIQKRIKNLDITLTQITDGISFDQQKKSTNHRYYIFEGRQERELQEAKSVVKRREEQNNEADIAQGEKDPNNGYNYPLDILSEDPKKIERKTKQAEKFAERNQGKVDVLLASMNMQVEAKNPRIFNSAIEYIYGTRFTKSSKSLDEIAKAVEQELSIADIKVDKQADNMIINIPLPKDDRIPIDGGQLIKEVFDKGIENPTHAVLGKSVENQPVDFVFSEGPHTLLAGASGSGKSVASKFTLVSMLAKSNPKDLKMQIIDPKQADFVVFNESPFNLTDVITDIKNDVVPFMKYLAYMMDDRYTMFKNAGGTENIEEYNEWAKENNKEKLPYIVIFIDELAQMMTYIQDEVETLIQQLGQMGRASGIHIIMSTQRPSREVLSGLIKTNLATRWALSVKSDIDSRIILEESGAEKLNGKGDMLFSPNGGKPIRAQGANITRKQLNQIFDALNEKYEKSPSPDYHAIVARREAEENGEDEEENDTFAAMSALQQTRFDVEQDEPKSQSIQTDEPKNEDNHVIDIDKTETDTVNIQHNDEQEPETVQTSDTKNETVDQSTNEDDALAKALENRAKRKAARKRKSDNNSETPKEDEQPSFEIDTSSLIRDKDME